MIEPKAFYITWIQVAEATTPVFLAIGYTDQPVNNNAIFFAQFGLVTITTFSDNKQLAGKAYADISISDRLLRHLLSKRWPHHLWTHRFYARIPPEVLLPLRTTPSEVEGLQTEIHPLQLKCKIILTCKKIKWSTKIQHELILVEIGKFILTIRILIETFFVSATFLFVQAMKFLNV